MVYLIQAEEAEIPYELFERLAAAMDESPEVAFADATHQLRAGHGILEIAEHDEALRLSARFAEIGYRTHLIDSLLQPPRPEVLDLLQPQLPGPVGLAVVAALHLHTQRKVVSYSPLGAKVIYPRLVLPYSGVEERTIEEEDSRYSLDLFTSGRRLRARPGSPVGIASLLAQLDLSGAYLNAGARHLQAGEHHLPSFTTEADYERYLTWLYQLRERI
jgi:hypothetical protein